MDSTENSGQNELYLTAATPASSSGRVSTPTKQSRVHFQAADDLLLLREVVSFEHPFVRRATCWEDIASALQAEFPQKFRKITARTLRERAHNLMDSFVKSDAKQRKQSGTEEELQGKGAAFGIPAR